MAAVLRVEVKELPAAWLLTCSHPESMVTDKGLPLTVSLGSSEVEALLV